MRSTYGTVEIPLHRITEIRARRIADTAIGEAEVRSAKEIGMRAVAYALFPLDPYSRTGRFRGPRADQIPEEPIRTNQPDSSRGPHSHSGLLEQGYQGPSSCHTDSRVPGLEADLHVTFSFVDQFRLR